MILGEKPGRESSSNHLYKWSNPAANSTAVTGKNSKTTENDSYTFSDVIEKACEGLMEQQVKYSIRRILEMQERLCNLEKELDAFLELRT